MTDTLLLEIGCEEIPARMIRAAATDLGARVVGLLESAGLAYGPALAWGGSRRLTVRVEDVEGRQQDRDQQVLGPAERAAFTPDGALTPAALGFAKKQGVDPSALTKITNDKGSYVGFTKHVPGQSVGAVLAAGLQQAVAGMSFPKSMRWGDAAYRWVRPVHWVLALHGEEAIDLTLFGAASGGSSMGHRFLSRGRVPITSPARYAGALLDAFVVADPEERRTRLAGELRRQAHESGGTIVEDEGLLEEVIDLVEWPGVVVGRFDEAYLELPREILITTLRHHQKCFAVERTAGVLHNVFLAVANTDRDPGGHVRRGNEWVVGGRLADARFFWNEDCTTPLHARAAKLAHVRFHAKCGSYADKAQRIEKLAATLAARVAPGEADAAREAAMLAKNDISTGLVGEFPELQGVVGGVLLQHEGRPEAIWRGVYEHYKPAGAEDSLPTSVEGALVSVADKLDSVGQLVGAGETPTGSKDPFGLRRALSGVLRIVEARGWKLSIADLAQLCGGGADLEAFAQERCVQYLKERGFTPNEVAAVLRRQVSDTEYTTWPVDDILARLEAIRTVRGRQDFEHLVDLTKRVDNILVKGEAEIERILAQGGAPGGYVERAPAAVDLAALVHEAHGAMTESARTRRYQEIVGTIARFIEPVERFFTDVLVIDPANPAATVHRREFLAGRLRPLLTQYFDIRELAGQADGAA